MRAVTGRIVVEAPASLIPGDLSLAGVGLILEPDGIEASAATDGTFTFPLTAIRPGASIHVEQETLPGGLAALAPVTVGDADQIAVRVRPARKAERRTFRSGGS